MKKVFFIVVILIIIWVIFMLNKNGKTKVKNNNNLDNGNESITTMEVEKFINIIKEKNLSNEDLTNNVDKEKITKKIVAYFNNTQKNDAITFTEYKNEDIAKENYISQKDTYELVAQRMKENGGTEDEINEENYQKYILDENDDSYIVIIRKKNCMISGVVNQIEYIEILKEIIEKMEN